VTSSDPFVHDDAAYVLNALAPEERAAYEQHLTTCAPCRSRVREIQDLPDLLAGIDADEIEPADPVPDTLLPGLLRRAGRQRRRQRFAIGALAAVAAACLVAVVLAFWPSGSSTPSAPQRDFVAVAQSPVRATASLAATSWGTAIDIHCSYVPGVAEGGYRYGLVAYDRRGAAHRLGDWTLPSDRNIDYSTGTALTPAQIARLEITLPDGTPLLRLRT
jgi:hypothetical protein